MFLVCHSVFVFWEIIISVPYPAKMSTREKNSQGKAFLSTGPKAAETPLPASGWTISVSGTNPTLILYNSCWSIWKINAQSLLPLFFCLSVSLPLLILKILNKVSGGIDSKWINDEHTSHLFMSYHNWVGLNRWLRFTTSNSLAEECVFPKVMMPEQLYGWISLNWSRTDLVHISPRNQRKEIRKYILYKEHWIHYNDPL